MSFQGPQNALRPQCPPALRWVQVTCLWGPVCPPLIRPPRGRNSRNHRPPLGRHAGRGQGPQKTLHHARASLHFNYENEEDSTRWGGRQRARSNISAQLHPAGDALAEHLVVLGVGAGAREGGQGLGEAGRQASPEDGQGQGWRERELKEPAWPTFLSEPQG